MKNILITGSSGMLGKDIYTVFDKRNDFNVYGADRIYNDQIKNENQYIGDLTDSNFLQELIGKSTPDLIIHCAAIVNLKTCEENRELTNSLHIDLPRKLVDFTKRGIKLLYISTDSIFDGERGNYNEDDLPNPLNYYAKTKLEGERIIKTALDHLIIRTNIFGFNMPLKNSLVEWAITNILQGNRISGFTDIIFNAMYTKDLAGIILKLINARVSGTYNVASRNILSKYSFLKYLSLLLSNRNDLVEMTKSDDTIVEIYRPKNTTLNVSKVEGIVGLPTIESGLENLIKDFKGLANETN